MAATTGLCIYGGGGGHFEVGGDLKSEIVSPCFTNQLERIDLEGASKPGWEAHSSKDAKRCRSSHLLSVV